MSTSRGGATRGRGNFRGKRSFKRVRREIPSCPRCSIASEVSDPKDQCKYFENLHSEAALPHLSKLQRVDAQGGVDIAPKRFVNVSEFEKLVPFLKSMHVLQTAKSLNKARKCA